MGQSERSAARCLYPQSYPTASDIWTELAAIAANQSQCASIYLPVPDGVAMGGEDHYQGMARTQELSDGSVYFFLAHSDVDSGGEGSLFQYRFAGPTDGEHVLNTAPVTESDDSSLKYSTLVQWLRFAEQHPSDITFLADVNAIDAGYLFVTEEYDNHRVSVYRWTPGQHLVLQGRIFAGFPAVPSDPGSQGGPQFVFLDRVGDMYHLGIASEHWGWGQLFTARDSLLFPNCAQGCLNVDAFRPAGMFPFPVIGGACQTKLIRDVNDDWYLLGYRSDPDDDQNGTDYVDVFGVRFAPFAISYKLRPPIHISFAAGDTGFASTGTHYVDRSGRLLVSSSYRWPAYRFPPPLLEEKFCRIDELPSG